MNFGIGKMRPMGHDHIYKYAHSKTISDMSRCCKNYLQDGDSDKNWHYVLPNLTKLTNAFTGLVYSEKMILDLPEVTEATGVISYNRNSPIRFMRLNMPKCTYCYAFAYQHGNGIRTERKFEFVLPNATDLSNFFTECDFFDNAYVKIYAPLCTNWGAAFAIGSSNAPNFFKNCDIDMSACVNGNTLFWGQGSRMGELYYTVDENGNHAFGTGLPAVGKHYTTFPNLSKGESMFLNCQLTKNYTTAILNDLPDWTNDTGTHNLTLGIHSNYKYDPELQKALLSVDNSYVPTMELNEYPTIDKNWILTVAWNGTPDENSVKPPIPEVEFAEIILPEGYTRLKFLESKADYYYPRVIDTGVIITNKTGAYVDGDKSDTTATGERIFMGTSPSTSWATPRFAMYASPFGAFYNANGYRKDWVQPNSNIKLRLNYKNDRFVWFEDDNTKYYADNLQEITTENPYPIYLFGVNMGGKDVSGYYVRIRRCMITEDQDTIRDFIPCLDTDGIPCMYDLIGKKPYYDKNGRSYVYEVFDENEG